MTAALLIGIALGFFGSIPAAGPLLFLVIDAGLSRDRTRALALAVGGALAEAIYVAMAFTGAGELLQFFPVSPRTLKLASAILVVLLGVWILRPQISGDSKKPARLRSTAVLTGFFLVLLNPGFFAFWSAIAAFVYAGGIVAVAVQNTASLAVGSAVGIVLWFSTVYAVATRATKSVSDVRLQALRRVVGVVLIALGVGLGVFAAIA